MECLFRFASKWRQEMSVVSKSHPRIKFLAECGVPRGMYSRSPGHSDTVKSADSLSAFLLDTYQVRGHDAAEDQSSTVVSAVADCTWPQSDVFGRSELRKRGTFQSALVRPRMRHRVLVECPSFRAWPVASAHLPFGNTYYSKYMIV